MELMGQVEMDWLSFQPSLFYLAARKYLFQMLLISITPLFSGLGYTIPAGVHRGKNKELPDKASPDRHYRHDTNSHQIQVIGVENGDDNQETLGH